MEDFPYRRLVVYQHAKKLVKIIYRIARKFPKYEEFALGNQIRRSSVSVCSNIAEGVGRFSAKDQMHFVEIAYGSLNEMMCQSEIAYESNYIDAEELAEIEDEYKSISKMLSGLRRSLANR